VEEHPGFALTGALTVMDSDLVATWLLASVTFATNELVPSLCATPEMVPDELNASPAGSDSDAMDQA
jgi:hypothetical protein